MTLVLFLPFFSFAQEGSPNIFIQIDNLDPAKAIHPATAGAGPQQEDPDPDRLDIQSAVEHAIHQALSEKFNYLRHNDLRDVMNHDKLLPSTARDILIDIATRPSDYAGAEVGFYLEANGGITAIGPIGQTKTLPTTEKRVYEVTKPRKYRREDAILSVTFERVSDVNGDDKTFDIDLLLFVHSYARGGHYFRKVNIQTDWNEKVNVDSTLGKTQIAKTTLKKILVDEIPLSATDFELHIELATQKAILYDKNNDITRVFPVTAGALDVRQGIDRAGTINSMTLLLPGAAGNYADFDFEHSVIIKRNVWRSGSNQEERLDPAYYKGRPFIGLVDRSRIRDAGNFHQGYRGIGFHYQINDDGLRRGFESHGCLRLQDQDLYTLDAVLNSGPKDMIPVEVRMLINDFHNLDSVYTRQTSYNRVVYSTKPNSPQSVTCKNKSPYPVRFFNGGYYHTVADSDCLTRVHDGGQGQREHLQDAVDYFTGRSSVAPTPLIWGNLEHTPISQTIEKIRDTKYSPYLAQAIDSLFPGRNAWVGDLSQSELDALLERLESGGSYYQDLSVYGNFEDPSTNNGGGIFGGIFSGSGGSSNDDSWPTPNVTRGQMMRRFLPTYDSYMSSCEGKTKSYTRSRGISGQCQRALDQIRKYHN